MHRTTMARVAALALLAGAAACNPVRDNHGFSAVTEDQKKIEVGVDTKSTVLARLGTPSTESAFDQQAAWYYVSTIQERYAFYLPKTVGREVTMIKFDGDGKVAAVQKFGMERGQVVAYSNDRTPTRGRELGIIEQIFGNIGNTTPIRTEDQDRGGGGRRR